jgi:hypothetical protein
VLLAGLSISILAAGCNGKDDFDIQNFEVFLKEDAYMVRGALDFKHHFYSPSADEAIQWAADRLSSTGGEIFIHTGKFYLTEVVRLTSNITLRGSDMGSVFVIDSAHKTGVGFLVEGQDKVTLKNFLLYPSRKNNVSTHGIVISNSGDCVVDGVTIVGMNKNGILLDDATFLSDVRNCRVVACGEAGIKLNNLAGGGRGGDFVPNNVTNCVIYGGSFGVVCHNALVANITNVTVYQSKRQAFYLRKQSCSVLISGCRTFQIQSDAVLVEDSPEVNISSSIFCWSEGHGIVLNNAKWGTVTGNNIIDNGSINIFDAQTDSLIFKQDERKFRKMPRTAEDRESVKSGIILMNKTKGVTVTGNAIFNWPVAPKMKYGILEDETCVNNSIVANNINAFEKQGVLSKGTGTLAINNVSFGQDSYAGLIGTEKLQYFDTRLMEKFIDDLWEHE